MTILLVIVAILVLCALRVPIAVAIGVVGVVGLMSAKGFDAIYDCALALYDGALNFPLLAIPLFILAGALMNTSGISRRLVAFTNTLIGFVRGGLSMVAVVASMFFAEISGSAVADVAALGSILIPAMKKRGYKPTWAAAVQSSAASLAIIIPAVDADDPLRRDFRHVDRPVVRRRRGAGPARRIRHAGAVLRAGGALQPAARGGVQPAPPVDGIPRSRVGPDPAGHHPGRHLQRLRHRDRGRRAGGVRFADHRHLHLSRTRHPPVLRSPERRRHSDGGRDVAGRRLEGVGPVPDRDSAAPAVDPRHVDADRQQVRGPGRCSMSCCWRSACSCTARRRSFWSCRS